MNFTDKIDLHMHTVYSDGTDSPADIVARVKEAGISLFSVTDHDAVGGCLEVNKVLKKDDPAFIFGVEFSCEDDFGKYHVLGYGYDPEAEPIKNIVDECHDFRIKRVQSRLDFLEKEFGFVFSADDREKLFALDNPGKPHIANLMVRCGYAPTRDDAFRNYLNKIKDVERRIFPELAIKAVLASGGIPVLAHPSFGSGEELILGEDMNKRLTRLIGYGLKGVEAFYSGFSDDLQKEMLGFAEKYGLYVTAGSDYHGTNKRVRLGHTNLDTCNEIPKGMTDFLAACPRGGAR